MWETSALATAITVVVSWTAKWMVEARKEARAEKEKIFQRKLDLYCRFFGTFCSAVLYYDHKKKQLSSEISEEKFTSKDPLRDLMEQAYQCFLVDHDDDIKLCINNILSTLDNLVSSDVESLYESMGLDGDNSDKDEDNLGRQLRGILGLMNERLINPKPGDVIGRFFYNLKCFFGLVSNDPRYVDILEEHWVKLWFSLDDTFLEKEVKVVVGSEQEIVTDDNRYFWLNSGQNVARDGYNSMLECGVACTYGPSSYRRSLERMKEGDKLFLFVSGRGIVGFGEIHGDQDGELVKTRKGSKSFTMTSDEEDPENFTEHSISVKWVYDLRDKPLSSSQIREAGNHFFARTFFKLRNDIGASLSKATAKKVDEQPEE